LRDDRDARALRSASAARGREAYRAVLEWLLPCCDDRRPTGW